MATKRHARVKLNRKAIDGVNLALADGMTAVGKAILDQAHWPDATPYGVGLVTSGGVLTYVGKRKVDGFGQDGSQPRKPRAVRLADGIIKTVVGWGFPARFQEFGTVHQPARPVATPARNAVVPRINAIMRQATQYRLKRLR